MKYRNKSVCFFVLLFVITGLMAVSAFGANYKKAYRKIVKKFEKSYPPSSSKYISDTNKYLLVYIDNDKIPELVCDHTYYYLSIYTYKKGKTKCLTYCKSKYGKSYTWPYGAMGNYGYSYLPKGNSVFNRNANSAGAEYVDTFYRIKKGKLKCYNSIIYDMTKNGAVLPERKEYLSLSGKYTKNKILNILK